MEVTKMGQDAETDGNGRLTREDCLENGHSSQLEKSEHHELAPPDGGWGWFVVLGCAIMHLLLGGLTRSYGLIYMELRKKFGSSAGITAWVGGVGVAVRMGGSPLATGLSERFSVRSVMFVGGLTLGLGMILSAFATSTEFMFFSYALLAGIGGTLVYAPAIVLVNRYFSRRRGIATGISTAGSGVGVFIFPPMFRLLFDNYGFFGTMLISGAIMFNECVCASLMRPLQNSRSNSTESKPAQENSDVKSQHNSLTQGHADDAKEKIIHHTGCEISKYIDFSLLKDPLFLSFSGSLCFMTMSFMAAQMLLPDFASSVGVPENEAVYLLSILGIADAVGRIMSGILFDIPLIKPNRKHFYNIAIAISALTCYAWAFSSSFSVLAVISIVHGLFNGTVVSQRAVIVTDLLGMHRLSSSFGLTVFLQGVGLMAGPSLAGFLRDWTGAYKVPYLFSAVAATLSFFLFLSGSTLPACKRRQHQEKQDRMIELLHS